MTTTCTCRPRCVPHLDVCGRREVPFAILGIETLTEERGSLQQRPAEHEQRDPKVDTQPGDIHQRGDERRRGRGRIEPELT